MAMTQKEADGLLFYAAEKSCDLGPRVIYTLAKPKMMNRPYGKNKNRL
jgi:hypothetical protein